MKIGVPKEIKTHEYRVGLLPASVHELVNSGHTVQVETNAGLGIGISDTEYQAVGANIVNSQDQIFAESELIVKVKEPQLSECKKLSQGQVLFTYLHLAAEPEIAKELVKSKATAIAYETVTDKNNRLPLLAPMSEVAGRIAVQVGAHCLEKAKGGRGVLLGGVPGVAPGKVVVIGGGVVGTNSIKIALGMGADVTVLDKSVDRLRQLDDQFGWNLNTLYATEDAVLEAVSSADLVVGAVLVPGASAPKVVTEAMLSNMNHGSVMVDVAIDQGGCFETSRPTNFDNPTYTVNGIIHQCVTNLPGSVPRTSTFALNNATLPFALELANKGYKTACKDNVHLANGVNVCEGNITHYSVANSIDVPYKSLADLI